VNRLDADYNTKIALVTPLPESPIDDLRTIELTLENAALLQEFFDDNPAFFMATSGEPAGPVEAIEEITSQVPVDMPFTKKWIVGYVQRDGSLAAMANIMTDLFAGSIHHIGTFIVATRLHGTGRADMLYAGIERWAASNGGAWLRLGVVRGNSRAERFWASQRFIPVRERPGIRMGERIVTVRNMVKPLAGGSLEEYFALAPRDRPVVGPD
jgi:GNAT superfamily N-acetyltransferase